MLDRALLTMILGFVTSAFCFAQVSPLTENQPTKDSTQTSEINSPLRSGIPLSSGVAKQWPRVKIIPAFTHQDQQRSVPIRHDLLTLPVFRFPIILCSRFPGNPILLMEGSTITFQRADKSLKQ